jgi:hypothetical protein
MANNTVAVHRRNFFKSTRPPAKAGDGPAGCSSAAGYAIAEKDGGRKAAERGISNTGA